MLQRDIDILRDLVALGDGLDQLVRPMRRVGVKQAHPEVAFDAVDLAQQGAKRVALARIHRRAWLWPLAFPLVHAEIGGVLRDEVDLFDAGFHQCFDFLDDRLLGARAVTAADLRDDAEGAGVVAALGDFHIRVVIRREAEARRGVVRHILRLERHEVARIVGRGRAFGFFHLGEVLLAEQVLDDRRDLGDLIKTDEGIDLGHDAGKLGGETLR